MIKTKIALAAMMAALAFAPAEAAKKTAEGQGDEDGASQEIREDQIHRQGGAGRRGQAGQQ